MITRRMLAGLHRMMPVKETVSYYVRGRADTFADAVTVEDVEWRPATLEETKLVEAGVAKEVRVWHPWREKLNGIVPKLRDYLQQSTGEKWFVAHLRVELGGERFCLICTKGTT